MRVCVAFPLVIGASSSLESEHASMIQPRHVLIGVEADGENLLKMHQSADNPCSACSSCVKVEGNSQGAADSHCAPCANNGQSWWPCDVAGLCKCGGDGGSPPPPPPPATTAPPPPPPATTAPPPPPPPPATTAAPAPAGGGTSSQRCGTSWAAAQNGQDCPCGVDSCCPSGQTCYGGFSGPSPAPAPVPPVPAPVPTPVPTPVPSPSGGGTSSCSATPPNGGECSYDANGDVASWFSLSDFNNFFPNIGGHGNCAKGATMLKYSCMIAAIQNINANKGLTLFNSGNVADDKRELAAWFGIMAQETTGGTIHSSSVCATGSGGGGTSGGTSATGGSSSTRCGTDWGSSVNGVACPNGVDSDCPTGQKCYGGHLLLETNSSANACTCSGAGWCGGASGCLDWALCWVEEQGCGSCPGYGGTAPSGHTYHGRGPKQLSWNYNYEAFSQYYCGDNTLLNYPERVASNSELAWASSIWFWVTGGPDNYKPGCHDVFTRTTAEGSRKPGLGWAINVVNGGLECGSVTRCDRRVASRVLHYKHYCQKFGVDPLKAGWTEVDNLYCHGQATYR